MIDLKLHPELKAYLHPESDSYFLCEDDSFLNSGEGQLCVEIDFDRIPPEQLAELLSGYVIPRDAGAFEAFGLLGSAVKQLSFILQNPGFTITQSDLAEWSKAAMETREKLDQAIRHTATVIKNSK